MFTILGKGSRRKNLFLGLCLNCWWVGVGIFDSFPNCKCQMLYFGALLIMMIMENYLVEGYQLPQFPTEHLIWLHACFVHHPCGPGGDHNGQASNFVLMMMVIINDHKIMTMLTSRPRNRQYVDTAKGRMWSQDQVQDRRPSPWSDPAWRLMPETQNQD